MSKKILTKFVAVTVVYAIVFSFICAAATEVEPRFEEIELYQYNYITGETEIVRVKVSEEDSWGEGYDAPEIYDDEDVYEYEDMNEYNGEYAGAYSSVGDSVSRASADISEDGDNGSDASVSSIIGAKDYRKKVSNVKTSPYQRIVCIEVRFDTDGDGVYDTRALGTGAMVSSDVVLTAAHVLYDGSAGTLLEIRVHYHQNSSGYNSTWSRASIWWWSTSYVPNTNSNYDWMVIKLQSKIGNTTGYFGYSAAAASTIQSATYTVSGYPWDFRYYMYTDTNGGGSNIGTYSFRHYVDTTAGQSGAAVYNSSNVIHGIHVRGWGSYNEAMRITTQITNTITTAKNY